MLPWETRIAELEKSKRPDGFWCGTLLVFANGSFGCDQSKMFSFVMVKGDENACWFHRHVCKKQSQYSLIYVPVFIWLQKRWSAVSILPIEIQRSGYVRAFVLDFMWS